MTHTGPIPNKRRPILYMRGVGEPWLVMSFAEAAQAQHIVLDTESLESIRTVFLMNQAPRGLWLVPVQP